jgi:hypothetical protein
LNLELTISILTDLSPYQHEQLLQYKNDFKVSSLFTIRSAAGRNWTLALLYEELHLSQIKVSSICFTRPSDFKMKGDIFESLLGELYTRTSLPVCGEEDERCQDLAINVIRSIVSFSLYRSQFLLSQEEIDLRLRLPYEKTPVLSSSALVHPTYLLISDEVKNLLSSSIPPEVSLDDLITEYLSILRNTALSWMKSINQCFKASRGSVPVTITPKMRDAVRHNPLMKKYPPLAGVCLSHLLLIFQSNPDSNQTSSEGGLYLLTSFDDIRPSDPQLYQDPEWKMNAVRYWKMVIQERFRNSHGTEMISARDIRQYLDQNDHLREEHPEITKKEYVKTIFRGCCSQERDTDMQTEEDIDVNQKKPFSPARVSGKKCDELGLLIAMCSQRFVMFLSLIRSSPWRRPSLQPHQ